MWKVQDNHLTQNHGYVSGNTINGFTLNGHNSNYTNQSGQIMLVGFGKAGGNKGTFNKDDVGHASASDVNMSVGALNNASYNQTQNWSAGESSPPLW